MTRVAIHQPEYFPLLGYLDKARRADVLVVLDDAQFDRSSLQHRARVVGANGPVWLTIPFVHRFPQRICEVAIADPRWSIKHRKTLQACYGRSPGWQDAAPHLEALFGGSYERVVEVTLASMAMLLEAFGIRTPIRLASELGVPGEKGDRVLSICRALGATHYLSGRTGAMYLDRQRFADEGIAIDVQAFTAPEYAMVRPLAPEELRGLSALDAWFATGTGAHRLLQERMDHERPGSGGPP